MITREGFKEWLQSKEPNAIVGHTRVCSGCPIATYLREATSRLAFVTNGSYTVDNPFQFEALPQWASSFIFKVDSSSINVTAAHALAVLNRV